MLDGQWQLHLLAVRQGRALEPQANVGKLLGAPDVRLAGARDERVVAALRDDHHRVALVLQELDAALQDLLQTDVHLRKQGGCPRTARSARTSS